MDIFNFVRDPYGYTHQEELMEEASSLLGGSIASSHLKDILQGKLGAYLHHLSLLPKDTPVLLEHLDSLDEYRAAMAFLRQDYPQYVLP